MSYSEPNKEEEVIIPDVTGESNISAGKISTFSSLRFRNFRFLLAGTTTANAGQWLQLVTLSWLVYDITGSGTILGTINMVRAIASLGMIPIAGLLIDRLKRRRLLMLENGWLLVLTSILGLMLVFGQRELLFLFVFTSLAGMVQTIDQSLRQVLVFDLVPRSHTPNAMALVQTGWGLMRSFGPALGGFLIVLIGPGGNFLIQSFGYVLIIFTILQIRFPPQKRDALHHSPMENIKEGLRHIMKTPLTRSFMLVGFILPLLVIPIFTILPPIYAVEVFGDGSGRILGFLLASVGVGGIGGGVVTASLGRLERRGLLLMGALVLTSLSLVGFAFSTQLWISLPLLAIAGFFEMIFLVTSQTLVQLSIPDSLRGRVTSVVNLNMALTPLGGMLAGVGSDLLGGPKIITIIMAGSAAIIALLVLCYSPTIRNYRLSQAIHSEEAITTDIY